MRKMTFVASAILATAIGGYAMAQNMPASVHAMNGMLMDAKGMTLYTWDNDKEADKSACTGNCRRQVGQKSVAVIAHPCVKWKVRTQV